MTIEIGFIKGLGVTFVMEGIDRETPFSNYGKYQTKPRIPIPTTVLIKIGIDKSKQAKYDQCIFSNLSRHGSFKSSSLSSLRRMALYFKIANP